MKHASFILIAAFGLAALGCTPPPEKTCDKLQELADKENEGKSKKYNLSRDKCLKNMNEMKERDPEAYKCAAKVIQKLSSLDTAFLAISVCDKNKPKKGADDDKKSDDDDDSSKKKKKKSSDDD
jgi:hypothetical protein